MKSYVSSFSDFGEDIWLNAASEGPLPLAAQDALRSAIQRKANPSLLTEDQFSACPKRLKTCLAQMIQVKDSEVI